MSVKSYDEMNAEQRFAYDAGRLSVQARLDAALKVVEAAREYVAAETAKEAWGPTTAKQGNLEKALAFFDGVAGS